jgi:hypothetical protein
MSTPAERLIRRLEGLTNSCLSCACLYFQDRGYSNYTVTDRDVACAKGRNPHLPAAEPYDWNCDPDHDNWPATQDSVCDYAVPLPPGVDHARFDVEGETTVSAFSNLPEEAFQALLDAGLPR